MPFAQTFGFGLQCAASFALRRRRLRAAQEEFVPSPRFARAAPKPFGLRARARWAPPAGGAYRIPA